MTYSHLTDEELVAQVAQKDNLSDLELELLQRLEQALNYVEATDAEISSMIAGAIEAGTLYAALRCLSDIRNMVAGADVVTEYVQ